MSSLPPQSTAELPANMSLSPNDKSYQIMKSRSQSRRLTSQSIKTGKRLYPLYKPDPKALQNAYGA
jgi:hypothetical protein